MTMTISQPTGRRSKVLGTSLLFALLLCGCGERRKSHLRAGIEKLREGDVGAAATLLELAAETDPDNASVHCNLGLAYWKLHQTERAVQALKLADKLSGGDERPLEFLGQIYVAENNFDEARKAFERAAERSPLSARILTSRAVTAYYAGEIERARTLLEQVVDINPAYGPALYNLGFLYRGPLDRKDKAAEYFAKYIRVAGDGPRRQMARKFAAAAGPLPRNAAASPAPPRPTSPPPPDPDEALPLVVQARTAIQQEEFDEALILINRAVKDYPDSADAVWLLAVLYDKHLSYHEKADRTYALFKTRFPDDSRADTIAPSEPDPSPPPPSSPPPPPVRNPAAARQAFGRGLQAYRLRDWQDAVDAYREAILHDSEIPDAFYNLGLAYRAAGKPRAARSSFQEALELDPEMLTAHYMLAVVCRDLNDTDTAISELNLVLKNDPHYAKAHLLLGLIHRDANRSVEAKRHLQRYVNLEPNSDTAEELKEWLTSGGD